MLEVLAGRLTVAGAAAELGVTRQTIYNWRAAFVAAGSAAIAAPPPLAGADGRAPTDAGSAAADVDSIVVRIVARLDNDAGELDFRVLEAVRDGAGMPVNRFCELTGIPRRTYYTRRAATAAGLPRRALDEAIDRIGDAHPDWGARRVWRQLTEVEGFDVSLATVKRRARAILSEARQMSS